MFDSIKNKITREKKINPSEKELKQDLRNAANQVSGSLTVKQYEEIGEYSSQTAINKFGSWNEAKKQTGLKITPSTGPTKNYTEDELLQDLRDTDEKVDGDLTAKKYNENGKHSSATYHQRFGSWSKAKKKAGIAPTSYNKKISDQQLVEELNKGKTSKEIGEEYGYSVKSFPTTMSQRLKRKGYYLRNKLSVPSNPENRSVILSIKQDLIERAGFNTDEDIYFEKEPRPEEGEIAIKLHSERVGKLDKN